MTDRLITRFYAPARSVTNDLIDLPDEEARHALSVLRMRSGDHIEIVDGEGMWYACILEIAEQRRAVARIVDSRRDVGEPAYSLTIGIPVLKQTARIESLIEKGTELGVTQFVPVVSERTIGKGFKVERLRRIAVAAMKQSGRSQVPIIGKIESYGETIGKWSDKPAALRVICHEASEVAQSFSSRFISAANPSEICVLVGPEGGFTISEVADAEHGGFQQVSLGPRRLRSETACIMAAALVAGLATEPNVANPLSHG
jgi:16S rRNA (uracil1498-N3)-methyltransferase